MASMSRPARLRAGWLLLLLSLTGLGVGSAAIPQPPADRAHRLPPRPPSITCPYDMRAGLSPSRLTIAMWDFSWLKGHYPGGPFEDWSQSLRELRQRGFNTVRIDAFPMLLSKHLREGGVWTVPADPKPAWGFSQVEQTHELPAEFAAFMRECQRQRLGVILSTWGDGGSQVTNRAMFWKCWEDTLDFLRSRALADTIVYVDFDQEFPYFSPFQKELSELASTPTGPSQGLTEAMESAVQGSSGRDRFDWNPRQMRFVKDYLGSTLRHFQQRYPDLRFTFSLTSYWKEVQALDLPLDVLELHIWIHEPRFDERSGFGGISKERGQADLSAYMARLEATLKSSRPMLLKSIENRMRFAQEWSQKAAAPLVTTEAWGPWWHMDQPDLKWDWLYAWCEQCMQMAQQYGFWGVTPWNYSHPYWDNWKNVKWYQRVNQRFRRGR